MYERWLDCVLAAYPADAAGFLRREIDRFANPVGQTLAAELETLVDLVFSAPTNSAAGRPSPEALAVPLVKIIKIRAIQDLRASEAVAFVFQLKGVVRGLVAAGEVKAVEGLAELEAEIDELALLAFDIYADCQRQLSQIRIDEVKRSVSGLVRRLNRLETAGPEPGNPNSEIRNRTGGCS